MTDSEVIDGIEALAESALGRDDEQSVALCEILRLIKKRKEYRCQADLLNWVWPKTDPQDGDLDG